MPHRLCPKCHREGRLLPDISKDAVVEYYRCDHDGHVWTHAKGEPNAPPKDVTVKPPR